MKDFIPNGTGDSRFLKSVADFLTRYPTYADFANAMVAGTLPVDFNGINPDGVAQMGTPLNRETLLPVELQNMFFLPDDATPADLLQALFASGIKVETITYAGTQTGYKTSSVELNFSFTPKLVIITADGTYTDYSSGNTRETTDLAIYHLGDSTLSYWGRGNNGQIITKHLSCSVSENKMVFSHSLSAYPNNSLNGSGAIYTATAIG